MLEKDKLEKLLIKNWSCFLNTRKLLEFATLIAKNELKISSPKITTLTLSHCEIDQEGLLIWIDYKILDEGKSVNATTELILQFNGSIKYLKTI